MPPVPAQFPGQPFVFSCGCAGVLPEVGETNKFAVWGKMPKRSRGGTWHCRILSILNNSDQKARREGYLPIPKNTPHSLIRKMMEVYICERCKKPLSWDTFGPGNTPNLNHHHITGEIHGFTHHNCNPHAESEDRDLVNALRKENTILREEIVRLTHE